VPKEKAIRTTDKKYYIRPFRCYWVFSFKITERGNVCCPYLSAHSNKIKPSL